MDGPKPTPDIGTDASVGSYFASQTARLRAVADTLDMRSTPWTPEPGDDLVGLFVGWSSGTTRRKETHPIALVETEAGQTFAVWAFYTVLRDELRKAAPQPGETILIRRAEDRRGPNGPYRVYRVVVDREDDADPFAAAAPTIDHSDIPEPAAVEPRESNSRRRWSATAAPSCGGVKR